MSFLCVLITIITVKPEIGVKCGPSTSIFYH